MTIVTSSSSCNTSSSSSSDQCTTAVEYTGDEVFSQCGFEGPEKRLEVDFEFSEDADLRSLDRKVWEDVVACVNGVILSSLHNPHFDAYLISESSMFVWRHRCVILTCGTTTLLHSLPAIVAAGDKCNLKVQYVQFSRKNFIFPRAQIAPHTSFEQETALLKQRYSGGYPQVLGPLDHDHWFCYISDSIDRSVTVERDQLVTIYMHDIDESVASMFIYGDDASPDASLITDKSGISSFVPGAVLQAHCFDKCGYSVNAMIGEFYFTMHITPEKQCSYASFETNMNIASINDLVSRVVRTFKPLRCQTVVIFDRESAYGLSSKPSKKNNAILDYSVKNRVTTECEKGYKITVTNYGRVEA